jgi:cytolysin-activating lysine-acyltransferase
MNRSNCEGNDQPLGRFETLGMVTALAMTSGYRNWYLEDIERNLLPALQAGQCKIYLDDERRPTAFVTWALVDEECHEALRLRGRNPPPDRWASGGNLWFIDVIAPFGNALAVIRDLQRNHFAHVSRAHSIKRNADGGINRIKVWRNTVLD